jgi:hypothetical protein
LEAEAAIGLVFEVGLLSKSAEYVDERRIHGKISEQLAESFETNY